MKNLVAKLEVIGVRPDGERLPLRARRSAGRAKSATGAGRARSRSRRSNAADATCAAPTRSTRCGSRARWSLKLLDNLQAEGWTLENRDGSEFPLDAYRRASTRTRSSLLHADSARNRLTGIGLVSLTYLLFALLDGSAKWLVGCMPVIMVVWLRFATHVVVAGAVLFPIKGMALVRTSHWRWHLVRALMFIAMTGDQLLGAAVPAAHRHLLDLLLGAAHHRARSARSLLGEKLDAGRWVAIIAGFAGVLVIVQPWGAEFHPAMLASVVNAVLYAVFMMMTRRLAAYDSPETIQYLPAVGAAIVLAPVRHRRLGDARRLARVDRRLPARRARRPRPLPARPRAPLRSRLGDRAVPLPAGDLHGAVRLPGVRRRAEPAVWIGAAIVIGSGLYLFSRERRRAHERRRSRSRSGSRCWPALLAVWALYEHVADARAALDGDAARPTR